MKGSEQLLPFTRSDARPLITNLQCHNFAAVDCTQFDDVSILISFIANSIFARIIHEVKNDLLYGSGIHLDFTSGDLRLYITMEFHPSLISTTAESLTHSVNQSPYLHGFYTRPSTTSFDP